MKIYKPPKTRIKIVEHADGRLTYQPQYREFFLWRGVTDDPVFVIFCEDAIYEDQCSADKRIEILLTRHKNMYLSKSASRAVKVTYKTHEVKP